MLTFHKYVATFFGIGFMGKGGGTVAAIVTCVVWFWLDIEKSIIAQVLITLFILSVGIWSGNVVDHIWGKDSSKVVIDEVAGMLVTLIFLPVAVKYTAAGLVLFRFFDIAKPFFIRKVEALPKGWGVIADDVLAGLYAHLMLFIIIHFKIF